VPNDQVVPGLGTQHDEINELNEESVLHAGLSSFNSFISSYVYTTVCTTCGHLASAELQPDMATDRLVCSRCGARASIFARARPVNWSALRPQGAVRAQAPSAIWASAMVRPPSAQLRRTRDEVV
jgi:hypothetical protein